jgi:hypothetical protein
VLDPTGFWEATAEFVSYDDGWRVSKIDLSSHRAGDFQWVYGPPWPDPYFNWGAFDESLNRY